MSEYLAIQSRELIIEAESAAEARAIAESVFHVRPGFDKSLHRSMRTTNLHIEKRRN